MATVIMAVFRLVPPVRAAISTRMVVWAIESFELFGRLALCRSRISRESSTQVKLQRKVSMEIEMLRVLVRTQPISLKSRSGHNQH